MRYVGRAKDERGAALVEMAVILPVLLLLVFGLIEFSRAFNAKAVVTHASREGVRVLAITGDAGQGAEAARAASGPLDPALIGISSTGCTPGEPTSMTVSYPFEWLMPLIGQGVLTISTTAVMRCGG
jgi:Flp pilus assembly protein TadG